MNTELKKMILAGKVGVTITSGNLGPGDGTPLERHSVFKELRSRSRANIAQALDIVINKVVDGDQQNFTLTPCIIVDSGELKLVELTKGELRSRRVVDLNDATKTRRAFITGGVSVIRLEDKIIKKAALFGEDETELQITTVGNFRSVLVGDDAKNKIYYSAEESANAQGVTTKAGYAALLRMGLDCTSASVSDDRMIPAMPLLRVNNF